jgi:hypothetical protein
MALKSRVTRRLGEKIAQILDKVAKTVAKPKNAKTSSKLNLKAQDICIKPLLNFKIPKNRQYFPQKIAWAFIK